MCKPSLNVVPNVYNRLQSSFLSLARLRSGRSLPKRNQWECWDTGLGPEVFRPSPSQCTPDTPTHLTDPPDAPTLSSSLLTLLHPLPAPMTPWCPLHSCWPPMFPDTPLPPTGCLNPPTPLPVPMHPWHFYTPTPLHPCQWECWDPRLRPNVVGLLIHLPPPVPLWYPTGPLMPLHPQIPWYPYTSAMWECWDPALGSNVVRLPVHLSPPMPPETPYTHCWPQCPTPSTGI